MLAAASGGACRVRLFETNPIASAVCCFGHEARAHSLFDGIRFPVFLFANPVNSLCKQGITLENDRFFGRETYWCNRSILREICLYFSLFGRTTIQFVERTLFLRVTLSLVSRTIADTARWAPETRGITDERLAVGGA